MKIKIGSIVGKWKVISDRFKIDKVYYNQCICICGKIQNVLNYKLNNYLTKSCGKCTTNKSWFKFQGIGDLSKSYFTSFKNSRKKKGIYFSEEITIEYLWDLFLKQDKKCAISNLDIILLKNYSNYKQRKNKSNNDSDQTASIDRIDNSKGYEIGNVQWVHKDVNFMRGGMTINDFIYFCNNISENNKNIIIEKSNISKRLYFKGK